MDIQKLARNQLDGILRAATSISGINYEQRIKELEKKNADLVASLKEIAKAEGGYSFNKLTHAENVIDNMRSIALSVLAKAGKD